MSVAAAQVEENLRYVYTLIAPIHLLRRTLTILNIMKQEALYAVYSIRRLSNMSRNQQGSCVLQIHLEIPPFCFRFRGRADWESFHCLMAWIWDVVPWHCQCHLPLTNVKTKPPILNVVTYSCWVVPNFSQELPGPIFIRVLKNQQWYLTLFFLTLREQARVSKFRKKVL